MARQYWAMRGFRAVTVDARGFSAVLLPIAVLVALTVLFAVVALLRFEVEDSKVAWA